MPCRADRDDDDGVCARSLVDIGSVNWGGADIGCVDESERVAELINDANEAMAELFDIRGGMTTWEDGSPAWAEYADRCREIVTEWDSQESWDLWCSIYGDSDANDIEAMRGA